ncbi:dihydrolipoamide acetyltransferase family protein [Limobrevibacterium gyesilva]|uniref:Dihydrolipoamide acetyltransferase component of pyruvate dehydrogenase complex n=1 Tax=Limobrevibacterium gyesilva TaxID=2991712 RepID=A0AA41YND4_9PROT|nr:dihydrolipoamide acetyltransferase family protein [Limobrevibacterium gyesilva]MCW3475258.1 2-oxo acid dehydrogenase subunit E2 [Limobrevibacterium gyesilva]
MGRYVFKLPDVGEGIAEAEVVGWHVQVGATVAEDDPLVDVMTDKATVEIPSPRAGRVVAITGTPGDKIRVGAELVVLEVDGEGAAPEVAAPVVTAAAPEVARPAPERPPVASAAIPLRSPGAKPLASPAVRRRAQELGIALQFIAGTGPGGRIGHADLDAYGASGGRAPLSAGRARLEAVEEVKIIGLRRRIAERMQESKRRIPHYSYVEELDVTALEELRGHLNARHGAERPRLTLLPFLVRALVRAIPRFPQVNALFDDEAGILRRHAAVHMGIATQTPQGLMVPVVRHAEALDLWEAASEIARLANAAREGKAPRDALSGSTITITSLGPIGGIVTTPVINLPEVAIIGVNRIVERPVVRDGQIVVRKMMNLSCSFDHRVVDGWDAAQFVQELKALLEQPATLFVE